MNDEFKFLVINTKLGWEKYYEKTNIEISDDGIISLEKDASYAIDRKIDLSKYLDNITDIALDECNFIYILDEKNQSGSYVLKYDSLKDQTYPLRCFDKQGNLPGKFKNPKGIVISNDTLYVADTDNKRIQAFARVNWQIKWITGGEDSEIKDSDNNIINFNPYKLVLDKNKNIYALDSTNQNILKFDKGGRFQGKCAEKELKKLLNTAETPNPIDLTIDNNNYLYVLCNILDKNKKNNKVILKFETDSPCNLVETFNLTNFKPKTQFSGCSVDLDGNIYIGGMDNNKVIDERFIYKFSLSQKTLEPLMGYQGSCYEMLMDKNNNIYVVTSNEKDNYNKNAIAILKPKENRYNYCEKGVFISKSFDSNEIGCKWHKIVLDAEIPDKTRIDIFYYTSDDEIYKVDSWKKLTTFQSSKMKIYDALILEGSGRYLKLKLELISSDEYKTPKISSLNLFFPRISYLRYLPAVYQEEPLSKEFLERFLSLFETFSWKLENEIDHIARYFDVESTPGEFLSWISTWIAAIFDESWSEGKKREFLKRAAELYKKRGTREGIEEIIEIYTGNKPIIVENWQLYDVDDSGDFKLKCEDLENEFFLFNWNDIPFDPINDNLLNFPRLLKFIGDSLDSSWAENIKVFKKTEDENEVICIYNGNEVPNCDNLSKITLYSEENKAILTLKDGRIHDLNVKKEAGNLNIYAKNPFEKLFGKPTPFSFCIILDPNKFIFDDELDQKEDIQNSYPSPEKIDAQMRTVRRIINLEKPAHTTAGVVVLQPWIYLDMHTYLGKNTYLSKPNMQLGISSVISRDIVLTDLEKTGQIDNRARIGMDTKLT